MSKHVYLTKTIKKDGKQVPTKFLAYRGATGENDDPDSFAKKMREKGHKVHLSDEYLGRVINEDFETVEV